MTHLKILALALFLFCVSGCTQRVTEPDPPRLAGVVTFSTDFPGEDLRIAVEAAAEWCFVSPDTCLTINVSDDDPDFYPDGAGVPVPAARLRVPGRYYPTIVVDGSFASPYGAAYRAAVIRFAVASEVGRLLAGDPGLLPAVPTADKGLMHDAPFEGLPTCIDQTSADHVCDALGCVGKSTCE